jgi:hypothetical protein
MALCISVYGPMEQKIVLTAIYYYPTPLCVILDTQPCHLSMPRYVLIALSTSLIVSTPSLPRDATTILH